MTVLSPPRAVTSLIRKLPSILWAMKIKIVPNSIRQNILFFTTKAASEEDFSSFAASGAGIAASASRRSLPTRRLPNSWIAVTASPAHGSVSGEICSVSTPSSVDRITKEKLPMDRARPKFSGAFARSSRTSISRLTAFTGIMTAINRI